MSGIKYFDCLLCRKPFASYEAKIHLCHDCWVVMGRPKNLEDAGQLLDRRPALENSLLRKAGWKGENKKS